MTTFLPWVEDRVGRQDRLVGKIAGFERRELALNRDLVLDCFKKLPAKYLQLLAAFFVHQVIHIRGKRVDKTHFQIIADGMNVIVGGMVKEVNGG